MAKLIFGMNLSLDGYVDHREMGPPDSVLFRHFIEQVRDSAGIVYGRRMYEVMRYWDDDLPDWDTEERDYAAVWRSQPKWVVSRSLKSVGPNATLVDNDIETVIRGLKAQLVGEIEVAGPNLAGQEKVSGSFFIKKGPDTFSFLDTFCFSLLFLRRGNGPQADWPCCSSIGPARSPPRLAPTSTSSHAGSVSRTRRPPAAVSLPTRVSPGGATRSGRRGAPSSVPLPSRVSGLPCSTTPTIPTIPPAGGWSGPNRPASL